jgi:hypothetical protein
MADVLPIRQLNHGRLAEVRLLPGRRRTYSADLAACPAGNS